MSDDIAKLKQKIDELEAYNRKLVTKNAALLIDNQTFSSVLVQKQNELDQERLKQIKETTDEEFKRIRHHYQECLAANHRLHVELTELATLKSYATEVSAFLRQNVGPLLKVIEALKETAKLPSEAQAWLKALEDRAKSYSEKVPVAKP